MGDSEGTITVLLGGHSLRGALGTHSQTLEEY